MSIPERIGKYEVLEAIGRGGFATVYRARDPLMKRLVATRSAPTATICAALHARSGDRRQPRPSQHRPRLRLRIDEAGVYLVEEY